MVGFYRSLSGLAAAVCMQSGTFRRSTDTDGPLKAVTAKERVLAMFNGKASLASDCNNPATAFGAQPKQRAEA